MRCSIVIAAASAPVLIAILWIAGLGPDRARAAGSTAIAAGTVMVSTGNGLVTEFDQNGKMLAQLDTTTASADTAGSAFDATGNFFVTDFEVSQVTKFDPGGALIGAFGSGYNLRPESIVFDKMGRVYVGQADGTHQILEFNSGGTPVNSFSPAVENRGTDWIDLASDQCTMFYTSEGALVKRFNVCTSTQLADFNASALPGAAAFAHRILLPFQFGAGGVLVADTDRVVRLDASGTAAATYTFPIASTIFALNLDPDGTSFWTADLRSGTVYKVDISTGTILKQWSAAGAPNFLEVAGLSVRGELTASLPTPTATPTATATPVGRLVVSPGRLDFGPVAVAHTRSRMITLSNQTNVSVNIFGASLSPTVPPIASFKIVSDTCSDRTLPRKGSCRIAVSFKSLIDADLPGVPDNDSSSATLTITHALGREMVILKGSGEIVH